MSLENKAKTTVDIISERKVLWSQYISRLISKTYVSDFDRAKWVRLEDRDEACDHCIQSNRETYERMKKLEARLERIRKRVIEEYPQEVSEEEIHLYIGTPAKILASLREEWYKKLRKEFDAK